MVYPKFLPNKPQEVSMREAFEHKQAIIEQLQMRRVQLGISQETLAPTLGLTEKGFSLRENGRGSNELLKFIVWAKSLGLELVLKGE